MNCVGYRRVVAAHCKCPAGSVGHMVSGGSRKGARPTCTRALDTPTACIQEVELNANKISEHHDTLDFCLLIVFESFLICLSCTQCECLATRYKLIEVVIHC